MTYQDSNIEFLPKPTVHNFKDLTHRIFGRLTPQMFGKRKGRTGWQCLCVCGTTSWVSSDKLLSGHTQSCGCLKREMGGRNKTHGLANKSKSYSVWKNMRRRCSDVTNRSFADYGGRGIVVCSRWDNFALFFQDMGEPPTPKHSLERVNNNKGYSPDNCVWATSKEQNNNKRNHHLLTYQNRTQNVSQWAEEKGMNYASLLYRVNNGWSVADALNVPISLSNRLRPNQSIKPSS